MAGHSKWSKVKHIKGPLDAKRGKPFSKLSKAIAVAAKISGGDPAANQRRRSAMQAARIQNMAFNCMDRAIIRGPRKTAGAHTDRMGYAGFAPCGPSFLIENATNTKNQSAADLRLIFTESHSNLALCGRVSYMFGLKGQIGVPRPLTQVDRLLEIALEPDAGELTKDEDHYLITTAQDRLYPVAEALKKTGLTAEFQKHTYIPETTVQVADQSTADQVMRLCEALEKNDDLQNAYSNLDVPEEIPAKLTA